MLKDYLSHPIFSKSSPDTSRRRAVVQLAAGGLGMVASTLSLAQFRVEVSGVGLTQLPISIVGFGGEAQSPQKISAIVKADLERS